ncbi:class II aaRS and biotin synthetase [Sistotremastrum niveocremeum HHB9708]|uniref:Class II aaRS and biotin synthetase n=1 Tax=Sistotremastrum niveocremeum HHB9708 TaxID=1314777 RepID=A0A164YH81_9AGAM|nr:class II aaRS and biotin synthetase [Sistotremastrum niveocremeum HHB9708]
MNVLVLSGPGVSDTCLEYTISSLKSVLESNYTVQTISPKELSSHPWAQSCALLVIPGGRDLPYVSSLAPAVRVINDYVNNGGSFLGICAGAYYASGRVEWEVGNGGYEVVGDRPHRFFPGIARGCVYPGFRYESDTGARSISLELHTSREGTRVDGIFYNGGGEFVDAETFPNVKILAEYLDDEGAGKTAAVLCNVGRGRAILWGPHLEFPINSGPGFVTLNRTWTSSTVGSSRSQDPSSMESERIALIRDTVQLLGLKLGRSGERTYSGPLPQFLTSAPSLSGLPWQAFSQAFPAESKDDPVRIPDINDEFLFRKYSEESVRNALADEDHDSSTNPQTEISLGGVRQIFICDGDSPKVSDTPKFNIHAFHQYLANTRPALGLPQSSNARWGIGELLLYGEAVTSTQTLLDRNPKLLGNLPTPLLSLASHQLSGRGRGANVWLSPAGCLQFSIMLRVSTELGSAKDRYVPPPRLVFIQYLMGLAVVEACRDVLGIGQGGERVRLKWPNDIYGIVQNEDGKEEKKKLGGIIVSTSFSGSSVSIVVGCGVNVFNERPSTSLSALARGHQVDLSMEKTAAHIMAQFESMWARFVDARGSFDPFMELYLERWLHSDEQVTLTTVTPHKSVRIVGLTPDHGLLRTVTEESMWSAKPSYIDLQPDGNSFDMMAGLIKTKT